VFTVGDFNSDGYTDIILQDFDYSSNFSILLGNGDGTFQPQQVVAGPSGVSGSEVTVGDFNNDGLLDFAYPGASYYVYIQQ
jgi:hypothetical protein